MGTLAATDMIHHAGIDRALSWHLQSNHYPPVPESMVSVCLAAIDAINEDDLNRLIDLPEGVLYRNREQAPAWAIAEAHHLDPFIDNEEF